MWVEATLRAAAECRRCSTGLLDVRQSDLEASGGAVSGLERARCRRANGRRRRRRASLARWGGTSTKQNAQKEGGKVRDERGGAQGRDGYLRVCSEVADDWRWVRQSGEGSRRHARDWEVHGDVRASCRCTEGDPGVLRRWLGHSEPDFWIWVTSEFFLFSCRCGSLRCSLSLSGLVDA